MSRKRTKPAKPAKQRPRSSKATSSRRPGPRGKQQATASDEALLTPEALARALGVALRSVRRYRAAGCPVHEDERGAPRFLRSEVERWVADVGRGHGAAPDERGSSLADSSSARTGGTDLGELRQRLRAARLQAELAAVALEALKLAQRRGAVLPAAGVAAAWASAFNKAKRALLALPQRLAPRVPSLTTVERLAAELQAEAAQATEHLPERSPPPDPDATGPLQIHVAPGVAAGEDDAADDAADAADDDAAKVGDGQAALLVARIRRTLLLAERRRAQLGLLQAQVLDVADVAGAWADMRRVVLDVVDRRLAALAPRLVGLRDDEAASLLRAEVHALLAEASARLTK